MQPIQTIGDPFRLPSRWDRPMKTASDRALAWTHSILGDHAFVRMIYLNRHKVTPDLWRSAQPTPYQIASFARAGVRTIVSLRGGRRHGSWPLEVEACARHNLKFVELVVRSRGAPDRNTILDAARFFETLEYPALVHCKSGADRAGFVSALYLILKGASADEALKQLSSRYGHFHWSATGILDAFFEHYRDEGEAKGIPFLEWVEHHYDPEQLERDFKPRFWSSLISDRILHRE
ncbi:fused DSP-PTPase phosphatase/NAD kinase-like protein [Terrarubrum flagellatum]|uniref:fused DSP-PTPase phosphatase/NAD kinase-like protein n=1 Tax=Terrirubrum flagellatum TaxID=2895980 RepID=UPI0031455511